MTNLSVVAKIVAKKDSVVSVRSELLKLIEPTRKEVGCIEYHLHQDNENPAVFIFHETWESLVCLENHMNTDHFKSFVKATDSLVEEIAVHKMTRIEQG
ncbi:MAG: antibiotic biosynthesis monooxygenase [Steroidobacteraceae bacterium]|nr:antibiotic biosynthesis monooxygenase [Deltaproteobacteria bacterium]